MEIKVKEKYYCPFKNEEEIKLSECTIDTEVYCNLQEDALCDPWDDRCSCPLIHNKAITVVWDDE